MRKLILLLLSFVVLTGAFGQELTVKSMVEVGNDISASQYRRLDLNDSPCALVKVRLASPGAVFEGNVIGLTEFKTGEYWVYMTEGTRELHIKHPNFLPIEILFPNYGIKKLLSLHTYVLTLIMPQGGTQLVDDGMRYLTLFVEPKNSVVTVNGQLQQADEEGTVSVLLPQGTHTYKVEARGYASEEGTVILTNKKETRTITLQSVLANVQVSCPTQGARIYVNNQLKGTTPWNGQLAAGHYQFEARMDGYQSQRKSLSVEERSNVNVDIPALIGIMGNLNVNYKPANSEVWLDGKLLGTSPDVFRNLLIGNHQVEIRAKGYQSKVEQIKIGEGKTTELTGSLKKTESSKASSTYQTYVQPTSQGTGMKDSEMAATLNKVVDQAMAKVNKETTIIAENQLSAQLGKGTAKSYDAIGMADAICKAIEAAIECNQYDSRPDAKGRVKPKYAEKNAQRIWAVRPNLVNIGQEMAKKGNDAAVLKYWGAFIDSAEDPFFASMDHNAEKEYVGQVAFFAGRYAFQAKDLARANKYFEVAKRDPKQKAEAVNFQLYAMRNSLKDRQDTLAFVNKLKQMYEAEPESDVILDGLNGMYEGLKDKVAQASLLDQHLAKYPNSFVALANKGLMAVNDNNAEEGAMWLRKAIEAKPDNAVVWTYLGTCLNVLAVNANDKAESRKYYDEAIAAFDKAKEIDPNKKQANWGYNRYQAYYGRYGADDPKTKQAEEDMKN